MNKKKAVYKWRKTGLLDKCYTNKEEVQLAIQLEKCISQLKEWKEINKEVGENVLSSFLPMVARLFYEHRIKKVDMHKLLILYSTVYSPKNPIYQAWVGISNLSLDTALSIECCNKYAEDERNKRNKNGN